MRGIITGASRGLGLALARALSERGWQPRGGRARSGGARACGRRPRRRGRGPGDVADADHRRRLVETAGEPIDLLVNNASLLGPSPLPLLARYPSRSCGACTRRTCSRRSRSSSSRSRVSPPGARIVNLISDAALEAYETWGGYGSSKAALAQITAVLGAEHPGLRVYAVDPGDMRTQMQQDAFPGEDISDRPPPEESVPGLLTLIEGDLPSGLYRARDLVAASA